MVEVYFYMPAGRAGDAVDCGIKLSEWYSRELCIDGTWRKCITALLNPRDEYEKFISSEYKCLKLEIPPKYCYVADRSLYEAGRRNPGAMRLYEESIIPVMSYRLGDYRFPEALVTSTVLGEQVSVTGKMLDTPVLYTNSRELYLGNLTAQLREEHSDLDDTFLYLYFKWLCSQGEADMVCDGADSPAVFILKESKKPYIFNAPGRTQ
ncbi:MAG TPA: hypothetical protein PLG72_10760 [Clostridiales bacterium]|nr:hypothetical protein [Clostridiales bacterium]